MVTPITNCSIPLPVFSGEKYDFWSLKLKTYFISQNLWDIVENGIKVPANTSALSEVECKNLKQEQQQKDAEALFAIQQAVEDTIFTEIADADTAKKAWDILEEKFDRNKKRRGNRSERLTRIGRKLYVAAAQGNSDEFNSVENIGDLLTPNKNTILHIHLTSETPSEEFVEQILGECGVLVLQHNTKGETPLHIAARYGHSSMVKLLIEHAKCLPDQDIENGTVGADKSLIRAENHENDTALHEAVRFRHVEVVKTLIESDPQHSYSARNGEIETPLYLATERGYTDVVLKILEGSISPAYDGPNGRTALHAAVIDGDIEMAQCLLEKVHLRAMIKHADKQGWVPLHHAVKQGYYDLTKLLLGYDEDENTAYMQDNEGRTALHIAAHCGHWILMEMIITSYPDCSEIVDNEGWNVVHHVVHGNSYAAMRQVVRNPMLSNLYNEKDVDGNTPLHHLAVSREREFILAFQPRVDKMAMNNANETALDVVNQDPPFVPEGRQLILRFTGMKRSRRQHQELSENNRSELVFPDEAKESHLLAATIIATVSFAAGFAPPGGKDNEGTTPPDQRPHLKAFIISDTVALALSTTAVFIYLFSPMLKEKSKLKPNRDFLSKAALSFTLVAMIAMIFAFAEGVTVILLSTHLQVCSTGTILGLLATIASLLVLHVTYSRMGFVKALVNLLMFSCYFFISAFQHIFHLGFVILSLTTRYKFVGIFFRPYFHLLDAIYSAYERCEKASRYKRE